MSGKLGWLMKNTKRTSIITLVLLLSIFKVYSQYMFRHWDVVDGMSDNQIRYFTMAPDGRMVIRTASILDFQRFDLTDWEINF